MAEAREIRSPRPTRFFGAVVVILVVLCCVAIFVMIRQPNELAVAIDNGDVARAKQLIERGSGIEPCIEGGSGSRLLTLAVRRHQDEIIDALLAAGANPDCCDAADDTPLLLLLRTYEQNDPNLPKIVDTFLKHGANPNYRGDSKLSPLHAAVFKGNLNAIKLLLDARANVNARDLSGQTPLEILSYYTPEGGQWKGIEQLLLERGADPNIANAAGQKPIERAKEYARESHDPKAAAHAEDYIAIIRASQRKQGRVQGLGH